MARAKRAAAQTRQPQILKTVSTRAGAFGPGQEEALQQQIDDETLSREDVVRLTQKGAITGFIDLDESEGAQGEQTKDATVRASLEGRVRRERMQEDGRIDAEATKVAE
jgi:hypothetical protein